MTKKFETFREIIDLWRTRKALADEVGAGHMIVLKWWQRDSIPVEWWAAIAKSKTARTAGIEVMTMAEIYARTKAAC